MPITRAQTAEMRNAAKTLTTLKYTVYRNTKAATSQRHLRNTQLVDRALLRKDAALERNTKARSRPLRKAAIVARSLIKLCASSDNECDIE